MRASDWPTHIIPCPAVLPRSLPLRCSVAGPFSTPSQTQAVPGSPATEHTPVRASSACLQLPLCPLLSILTAGHEEPGELLIHACRTHPPRFAITPPTINTISRPSISNCALPDAQSNIARFDQAPAVPNTAKRNTTQLSSANDVTSTAHKTHRMYC